MNDHDDDPYYFAERIAQIASDGDGDVLRAISDDVRFLARRYQFVARQLTGATWHRTRDTLTITIEVSPDDTRTWIASGLLT